MEPQTGAAAAGSSSAPTLAAPNTTELMIALSQIQQLIPLLDYRPGGLAHLLPTLLTPLLPTNEAVTAETMQRYRANVDHAFRVAQELVARVQDGAAAGSALELAQRLMEQGDEKARVLRVRRKRRIFQEQEKVLEVNSWGPPLPPRANVTGNEDAENGARTQQDREKTVEVTAFLPSQNPPNTILTSSQSGLPQPTTAQAVHKYLAALQNYLEMTSGQGLAPQTVPLKDVKARITDFSPQGFSLEVQIAQLLKATIDASFTFSADAEGELKSVDLAGLTAGAVSETLTSTTPSAYPIFRTLSTDIVAQTQHAISSLAHPTHRHVWTAYTPITETVARLILAAAQFQ